jgi:hypothetical protein
MPTSAEQHEATEFRPLGGLGGEERFACRFRDPTRLLERDGDDCAVWNPPCERDVRATRGTREEPGAERAAVGDYPDLEGLAGWGAAQSVDDEDRLARGLKEEGAIGAGELDDLGALAELVVEGRRPEPECQGGARSNSRRACGDRKSPAAAAEGNDVVRAFVACALENPVASYASAAAASWNEATSSRQSEHDARCSSKRR